MHIIETTFISCYNLMIPRPFYNISKSSGRSCAGIGEGSGTKKDNIRVTLHNNYIFAYFFRCSFHHRHKDTNQYGRLLYDGSACLAWESHYMFRNFLLSTSRRVLYVMTDNKQAKQTLRVATFNVLAPCYNWLRYVILARRLRCLWFVYR